MGSQGDQQQVHRFRDFHPLVSPLFFLSPLFSFGFLFVFPFTFVFLWFSLRFSLCLSLCIFTSLIRTTKTKLFGAHLHASIFFLTGSGLKVELAPADIGREHAALLACAAGRFRSVPRPAVSWCRF